MIFFFLKCTFYIKNYFNPLLFASLEHFMTWGKIYYVSSKALHNTSTYTYVICVYIDRLDIFCKYLQIFDLLVLNTKLFLEFCLPTFVISQILFILYKRCKWYKKGGLTTRGHSLTMLTRVGRVFNIGNPYQ